MAYVDLSSRFHSALEEIRGILQRDPEMVKWEPEMLMSGISETINNIAPTIRRKATYKKKISASLRLKIYRKDGYMCVLCCSREDLSLDHIIPESKGGVSTIDNLQTLCRHCNAVKGSKI